MPSLNQLLARVSDMFGRPGIPLANRNLFVDPGFDALVSGVARNSAQTVGTTLGYNALSVWLSTCGTGGAGNIQSFDLRSSSNSIYAAFERELSNVFVYGQTTASTGTVVGQTAPIIAQRVEGANTGAGKSLTFSIKLWVSSGSITVPAIRSAQYFGTGGSPSASVALDKTVNWTVTTTPQKFSVRLDIPTVAGKTFGTSGGDYLLVGIYLPPGVTFTLGGAEAQLEYSNPNSSSDLNGNGGAPTAFEYRGAGPELARVQRLYVGQPYASGVNGYADVATRGITVLEFKFPVAMRASPAISITNGGGVNVTIGAVSAGVLGFNQSASAPAAGFSSYTYTFNAADARL